MKTLFETLSSAINPKSALEQLIEHIEKKITIHYESIHDLEKELETLKKQLHDTPKTHPNPANTLGDDLDYDMACFV